MNTTAARLQERFTRVTGLTSSGTVVAVLAVLTWLLGRYIGGRPLYILSYALLLVLGVAYVMGRRAPPIEGRRSKARLRLAAGETVSMDVDLEAERRVSTLILEERLPEAVGETARFPVAVIEAGETVSHSYPITCRRRGVYEIGPLVVKWGDPFGLTRRERVLVEPVEILVHPSTEAAEDRPLTRLFEDPPMRPPISKPWPTGLEFYGMRPYNPGDDVRRVVWRAFARTGQLLVRDAEQGITDKITIVLDQDREYHSAGEVSASFETAVRAAASVGVRHIKDGYSLTLEGNEGRLAPVLRGPNARIQLLDALARVERVNAPLTDALGRTAMSARGNHVVVVTPRLNKTAAGRLELLVERGISVLVVALLWGEESAETLTRAAALGCQVVELRPRVPLAVAFRRQVGAGDGGPMTTVLEPEAAEDTPFRVESEEDRAAAGPPSPEPEIDEEAPAINARALGVAALSTSAAALMAGGIYGTVFARVVAVIGALIGVAWCALLQRNPGRRTLIQLLLPVVLLAAGTISLVGTTGGPTQLPHLVREAVKAGNLLRPPVPFDPGWRPILIAVMALIGFAAASVGEERPQVGLLLPVPLLALTAITQPKSGQFLSALAAVIPFIGAVTVLFGGDLKNAATLTRQFELRRAIRAAAAFVPIIGALAVLNSTSILFPKPAFNPAQKPQKPKAVPLSAAQDRVLFTVDGPITGPWKLGSLDVYDGTAWKLPPFDPKKLQKVPANGVIDKTRSGDVTVKFTVGDLGTSATLPGVVGPVSIATTQKVLFDPHAGTFRVPTGRVPAGLVYKMSLPTYPSVKDLKGAPVLATTLEDNVTFIPSPPPAVRTLLETAPVGPYDRMNFLLQKLNAVEIAVGAGVPVDTPPATVQRLLAGNHKGSPYEIVSAEAMLARWAGVPSRIGFGFDGEQKEGNVLTVRPRNAAQWLEVYFEGRGWVPIVTPPPRAQESLDNDKNTKFNPTIQAGPDVAIQLYIPVKEQNLRLLYQQVRDVVYTLAPFALLLLATYLATPWAKKTYRRTKRRRWAAGIGPAAEIAVEYAEFRDRASDLGIGNPYDTPLEFLDAFVDDDEHEELAWLVAKALYGDLQGTAGPEDVAAARELSASLSRRMRAAQPFQTRALATLTRSSLLEPYSAEMPNISVMKLPRLRLPRRSRRRKVVLADAAS